MNPTTFPSTEKKVISWIFSPSGSAL